MTGKEDKPENYATVTYKLSKEDDKTMLSLSQDNNENEETKEGSIKNWKTVLKKLKEVVENNWTQQEFPTYFIFLSTKKTKESQRTKADTFARHIKPTQEYEARTYNRGSGQTEY